MVWSLYALLVSAWILSRPSSSSSRYIDSGPPPFPPQKSSPMRPHDANCLKNGWVDNLKIIGFTLYMCFNKQSDFVCFCSKTWTNVYSFISLYVELS